MKGRIIQKYLVNNERKLSYSIGGCPDSDKGLLFLNGVYNSYGSWRKQGRYPYFYRNYKQIFFDYRGLGNSIEKSYNRYRFDDICCDIVSILKLEKVRKISIIAYCVGGVIALWFAYRYNDYIASLNLIGTTLKVDWHVRQPGQGIFNLLSKGIRLEYILPLLYPWIYSDVYLEKMNGIETDIVKGYSEYNKDIKSFKLLLNATDNRPDLKSIIKDISTPTLILGSLNDVLFPIQYQNEIVSKMPNCIHLAVKETGHAMHIERSDIINKSIEQHLKLYGV
ncbi:MAG: alpha/beta hydrolase [Spirochaetales bacterium]|nr:alpha/beta hydrolase [Spirochaetales bacterium]